MIKSFYHNPTMGRQYMKKDQLIKQVQTAGQHETRVSLLFRHHLASKVHLHPTDMECLEIIINSKQTTPGSLSQETGLSTGAMTAALGRLERRSFITRAHSTSDRRKVIVEPIMENIQQIYALYMPFVVEATALLEKYSDEELQLISRHYDAMATIYETQIKDAS